MQRAAEVIRLKKISLLIFPEGGRTEDGVLQPFKDGAAYIAIRAGVPLVPMVILGARESLPYGGAVVLSANVTLRILKPIDTTQFVLKDRGRVTDQMRELILAELTAGHEAPAELTANSSPS
jgi:1-acyl-sn-glycerol-3-phosphate acyltransferase